MGLVSSWEQRGIEKGLIEGIEKGRQEGKQEGKEDLVVRLIRRRFGVLADLVKARIDRLSADQLDLLGEALLDFTEPSDLENWLDQQKG